MNPFKTVRNYSEMLTKIASCTFFITIFLIMIIRANIDVVNQFLLSLEPSFKIKILDVEQSVLTIIIPLFLAFISFSIKLHDKIASVFKIRQKFDVKYILAIMSKKVNLAINYQTLLLNRNQLMNKVFYKYTSSREEDDTISRHSIELAINQWTVFWIFEEAIFFSSITILILLIGGSYKIAVFLLFISLIGLFIMKHSYDMSIRYAEDQINEIMSNTIWKGDIEREFNGI